MPSIKPNIKYALEFKNRLNARMSELGLAQKDICKLTGISAPYISQLMNGDHVPRADMVVKLARALKMSTDELINFTV